MSKVALFLGSFNPIHNGHLILANYIAEYCDVDEVRFVVSPQNPFKQDKRLLPDKLRLELAQTAIGDYPKFSVSDIEFNLPKPSYTYHTLSKLLEQEPETEFVLLIGGDNLRTFPQWKNAEELVKMCELWVYPRPKCDMQIPINWEDKVKILEEAPMVEVSSTAVRQAKKAGKDLRFFLPAEVWSMLPEDFCVEID
jgi:nicotinate-nucleotide adenylyltransferase